MYGLRIIWPYCDLDKAVKQAEGKASRQPYEVLARLDEELQLIKNAYYAATGVLSLHVLNCGKGCLDVF